MMQFGNGMMGGYGGGLWMSITWLVWTLVGIFAAVWLWQQIRK